MVKVDAQRNEQVVRILRLLRDLDREGGADLYELATRFGTTTRTIRRDLEAIEEAGIPVVSESHDGPRKRWRLDTGAPDRLSRLLEASHFLALRMAMAESAALRKNDRLYAVLEDLAERIEKAIGTKGRAELRALDAAFFSWEKFAWREAPPDLLWPLVDAIARRRLVRVTYRAPSSGNKPRQYRVLPLKLVVHDGALYLHAWQSHFKTVLLLNLQRLTALEVQSETAELPEAYDPDQLERTAFGIFIGKTLTNFELEFDAFARPYIEERTWHPSQRLTARADGGVTLRFTCTPSYEVTNWIASWREHVVVTAPAAQRDTLRAYGAWLQRTYGGSDT